MRVDLVVFNIWGSLSGKGLTGKNQIFTGV